MKNPTAQAVFVLASAPLALALSAVFAPAATLAAPAAAPKAKPVSTPKTMSSTATKAKLKPTPTVTPKPTATANATPAATPAAAPSASPATNASPTPSASPKATTVAPKASIAIAASVNNDRLTRADLNRMMASIEASDKSLQTGTETAKQALATLRQSQIENWIDSRLLLIEAAKRKIVASPVTLDALMKSFRAEFPTTATYQAFLKSGGKTEAQLRRFYSEQLMLDELTNRIVADVVVSDADVQKFYDAPPLEFEIPNQARARHILFRFTEKMTDEQKAKLRAQAEDVLKKAQTPGADFQALISQYTQDPGARDTKTSKGDGGDTGAFSLEEALPVMKPFAEAVFAAQSGQILGPIETDFGYHIIRVDEASHKPKLDRDLKDTIRGFIVKQRVKQKLDNLIAQLKPTAKIVVNG